MNDEHYMQQALKEARKAYEEDEVPIGAVIVMGDRIIARGHNQTERLTDPTAHAEIIALTSAFNHLGSKYLPEASIYITVEPCLMCAGALYWSKIGRVVFGADDDKNGYRRGLRPENFPGTGPKGINPPGNRPLSTDTAGIQPAATGPWPFHPKTVLTGGILRNECARLMQEFFQSKRW
jgi:tRNA(adenine34) deaminase